MADDTDSSSLSSAPDEEQIKKEAKQYFPIFGKVKPTKLHVPKESPKRPPRPASPPREVTLADNPDIALIVMFRSRFADSFPGKLAHLGPQDVERGVVGVLATPVVESLLCALLALVLNRKKPVERGHHSRALEEAVLSQKHQWPRSWQGRNPLHGNRDFSNMGEVERLNLLRTLIMWSLTASEAISTTIKEKYKQQRHSDDENQPLSVQPWGSDGDKRRYFLIQGLDDTHFRVYREGSRHTKNAHWYNVAGSIDELKDLARKMEEVDGSQIARRFAVRIKNAIPTFEASEEKRQRREYRQVRRAAFTRPEPGFSLYEGRTRGKRMRYTYDDDDDSDTPSTRRSTRQSARTTPFEPAGPTFTASGRQIRQPRTGEYGEGLVRNKEAGARETLELRAGGAKDGDEDSEPVRVGGRSTRAGLKAQGDELASSRKRKLEGEDSSVEDMSEEEDAAPSGEEWDSDKNEADEGKPVDSDDDEQEEASLGDDEEDDSDEGPESLVLKLKLPPAALLKCERAPLAKPLVNGVANNHFSTTLTVPEPIIADHATADSPHGMAGAAAHALLNGAIPHQQQAGQKSMARAEAAAPSTFSTTAYPTPLSSSSVVVAPKPPGPEVATQNGLDVQVPTRPTPQGLPNGHVVLNTHSAGSAP